MGWIGDTGLQVRVRDCGRISYGQVTDEMGIETVLSDVA